RPPPQPPHAPSEEAASGGVAELADDEAPAVRDLERERVAAHVIDGVDDEVIRHQVARVVGMRIDRDAAGLTQGHVEALDDVRSAAEHGVSPATAVPAYHERERVLGLVRDSAYSLDEKMRS